MLGIDDLNVYGDNLIKIEKESEDEYEDEGIDEDLAKRMIENVIEGMADTKYKKKRRRLP